jgi:hypothetical protein
MVERVPGVSPEETMIEAKVSAVESFGLENIQEMVKASGPCVTVLLPSYRPGAQAKSMAAILKTNLQEAARQLALRKISGSAITDLLDPLEQLTQDEDFLAGSRWGRAIFRSSEMLRQLQLIGPVNQALTIGACFNLRPILAELHLPAEFYLLELSKKRVDLFRCNHLQAQRVELPSGVPDTLDEALAFKQPDHDLENRAAAGASAGAMSRIRFGTGSGRETQQTYLSDFYKAVDRGVRERLNGSNAPLVLAGVHEDTAIYRTINTYPNLLARSISGSPSGSTAAKENEIVEQAYWIVRSDTAEKAAKRLAELKERVSPGRFSVHLEPILHAAAEGRVDTIYIDESAQRLGLFADAQRVAPSNWGEEDLLNRAAVETILHGGLAFALPNSGMPDGAAVAAVFRY